VRSTSRRISSLNWSHRACNSRSRSSMGHHRCPHHVCRTLLGLVGFPTEPISPWELVGPRTIARFLEPPARRGQEARAAAVHRNPKRGRSLALRRGYVGPKHGGLGITWVSSIRPRVIGLKAGVGIGPMCWHASGTVRHPPADQAAVRLRERVASVAARNEAIGLFNVGPSAPTGRPFSSCPSPGATRQHRKTINRRGADDRNHNGDALLSGKIHK
jgi:hypothetical protein